MDIDQVLFARERLQKAIYHLDGIADECHFAGIMHLQLVDALAAELRAVDDVFVELIRYAAGAPHD